MPLLEAPRPKPGWASSSIRAASDRRLARRASTGDQRALATIFERYQQELYSFCLGILGEPQDAQDALQNTMVKVLRALPGEEREIALRPWLYRIAHNEAVELRRTGHPTQALDGHLVDVQAGVAERAEQREQLDWLLKDLGDLPERQRTVLVMRELSGLDFAEIAAALDTSGAVVRQALYEARRNLEQMDQGRGLKCDAVTRVLSDADRRITRRRDIRAHLRGCSNCRRFRDAIDRREGVLATIPPISLPAGAATGAAQALFGGSGGSGTVAALSGGVAKSAGAYGAIKAAGTLAAVAVIGTAAIQGGMNGAPQGPPARQPLVQQEDSPRSVSSQAARSVAAASVAGASYRFASTADKLPRAPGRAHISDRRARDSSADAHEPAFEAAARPTDLPQAAATNPAPPLEAEATPGAESTELPRPGKPGGGPGQTEKPGQIGEPEKDPGRSRKPEKQPGSAAKPEKKNGSEHPASPSHSSKVKATSASDSPPRSATDFGPPKTPPGQAKKQASAEAPAPSSAPPSSVETSPASTPEAPLPTTDPGPNGKAKGHDK